MPLSSNETADLLARGFRLEPIAVEDESRLALRDLQDPKLKPLFIDFASDEMRRRFRQVSSEPLVRALGIKNWKEDSDPLVIDATAGLGTDAFLMAGAGCRVRAIERSPAIFELLNDGLVSLRALVTGERWTTLAARLSFERGDAIQVLRSLAEAERPDFIYLDPMFPEDSHSKSALPKKTMQMFRRLLDGDEDAAALFEIAIRAAHRRVIVKRPPGSATIGALKPSQVIEGKTARFDIYVVPKG